MDWGKAVMSREQRLMLMDSHRPSNNGVRPGSTNSQGGVGRLGGVFQQERESSHLPFGEAKHQEGSKGQRCGRVAAPA